MSKLHTFTVIDDVTKQPINTDEIRITVDDERRGLVITCRRTDGQIAIYADDLLAVFPRSANVVYLRNVVKG